MNEKNLTKERTRLQNIQQQHTHTKKKKKKSNLIWMRNPCLGQGQNKYHYTLTVKEKGPRKKFSFKFHNVILPKREQATVKNIQWNLEEFQDTLS